MGETGCLSRLCRCLHHSAVGVSLAVSVGTAATLNTVTYGGECSTIGLLPLRVPPLQSRQPVAVLRAVGQPRAYVHPVHRSNKRPNIVAVPSCLRMDGGILRPTLSSPPQGPLATPGVFRLGERHVLDVG